MGVLPFDVLCFQYERAAAMSECPSDLNSECLGLQDDEEWSRMSTNEAPQEQRTVMSLADRSNIYVHFFSPWSALHLDMHFLL